MDFLAQMVSMVNHPYRVIDRAKYATFRNQVLRERMPQEQPKPNKDLTGKTKPFVLVQDMCDWLNSLASKIGIERSVTNPDGYFCAPSDIQ